jgi:hypothetical protein
MLDEVQLRTLLRVKRYEQPPPGYFDDLLHSIHRRQREELLRRPAWQIALERVRAFFAPVRVDWAHAASMAGLLVVGIAVIRVALPDRVSGNGQFASGEQLPGGQRLAAASQTEPMLTLEPRGQAGLAIQSDRNVPRSQVMAGGDGPTRFIIDAQPVSYEKKQFRF